jgi:hypothetical protein
MSKTTFICPEVKVPSSNKRKYSKEVVNKPESSSNRFKNQKSSVREELKGLVNEVKNFSAQSYKGYKKILFNADKLTKLGAPPLKQQKMPFHCKIKVDKNRKLRKLEELQAAKESGVVLMTKSNSRPLSSKKLQKKKK